MCQNDVLNSTKPIFFQLHSW